MEYYKSEMGVIYCGDVIEELKKMPDESINMCVTSPPYWNLRNYGVEGQIGLEETPDEYINKLVNVFREVHRVLKKDGTLWLNIGDSYWGSGCGPSGNFGCPDDQRANKSKSKSYPKSDNLKDKDLVGIPWMLAFALRDDGWWLRQDIIWAKKNCMPESVKDRCVKSHEYIFLLSKSEKYYFDYEAIMEFVSEATKIRLGQRNLKNQKGSKKVVGKTNGNMKAVGNINKRRKRSVWFVRSSHYKGAHFATFPTELINPCILAGCPEEGVVLDPFFGSGTTGAESENLNRNWIGIDLNKNYCDLAIERITKNKDIFTAFRVSKG